MSPVKRTIVTLAILVIAVTAGAAGTSRLVCYYTNWSHGRPAEYSYQIEDIPGNMCTHVAYAFVGLDESTSKLVSIKPEFDEAQSGFTRFRDLKKRFPDLRLIVSLGGWTLGGGPISKMVSTRHKRQQFVASVVSFMAQYDLDGFEIVWLWPGASERDGREEDKDNLYYLANELKTAFQVPGAQWELSVQVPIDRARIVAGYHQEWLCEAADYIHLTGYDLRGHWTGLVDVHSILKRRPHDNDYFYTFNIKDGVESWLNKGCKSTQIVLGLPMFGRTFTLQHSSKTSPGSKAIGPGEAGSVTNDPGVLGYFELCKKLNESGWTIEWDTAAESPYVYRGNQWIGYENERSLEEKFKWITSKRLAGVYAYTLDLDDYRGKCGEPYPLLQRLYNLMKNASTNDVDIDFALWRQ